MPFHIAANDFWHQIFNAHGYSGGAYKILAYQNGSPVAVPRWLDTDPEGVLYIGKAEVFTDRVINFKKAIQKPNGRGHSGCRAYRYVKIIAERFPFDSLYAEFFPATDPFTMERQLRLAYVERYGEVPPLNSQK